MGISRQQALDCFQSEDLVGIGMEADAVRRKLHPEGVVSYAVECRLGCRRLAGEAAEAGFEPVYAAAGEAVDGGATGVWFAGGGDGWGMKAYEEMVGGLRQRFAGVWLEGLTADDVLKLAERAGLSVGETLARLAGAGLDSIGGYAGYEGKEWLEVHRTAHGLGMRTMAAMVFGGRETAEQRVELLERVRGLQEETGGFRGFVPVAAEAPGGRELDGLTAVERLKALAISRMVLENVEHVQVSAGGQGLKVLQMGLRFGGDDAGSVGPEVGGREEELRRIIRDAGFRPVQRDSSYRVVFLG